MSLRAADKIKKKYLKLVKRHNSNQAEKKDVLTQESESDEDVFLEDGESNGLNKIYDNDDATEQVLASETISEAVIFELLENFSRYSQNEAAVFSNENSEVVNSLTESIDSYPMEGIKSSTHQVSSLESSKHVEDEFNTAVEINATIKVKSEKIRYSVLDSDGESIKGVTNLKFKLALIKFF